MKKKNIYKNLWLWASLFALGCAAFAISLFFYITSGLPPVEELQNRQVVESTKIYDRTGTVLLYDIHGEEKRTVIKSEEIPKFVKDATVSVEDASFFTNPAFDWRGILRAIAVNIIKGRALQGGSTITQQLAKKSFLTDERTIWRKLKELVLASRLEKKYTKDEILTLYLNQIPYGSNTYGIEAAAETFFNKKAGDLTLSESALLAALPNAPSYYSPWGSHTKELMARKNYILDRMHELGYIDSIDLATAKSAKIEFAEQSKTGIKAPHFVEYVQDYLNNKYGEGVVRTSGLKVTTTLDWDLQQAAETAVKDGVKRNTDLYGGMNGALVASDPKTGQILAMVGSADYFDSKNEGNFNVATQGLRQPGSTFKPFAYLTAFEKGFTPDTILWDVPTEFSPDDSKCPTIPNFSATETDDTCYHPQNNDGIFRGPVKMKEALSQSLNLPSVKTLYLAGVGDTISNAQKFGIATLSDRSRFGLSLVLGGGEVKLVELVNAYGVFATEGVKHDISAILKVEDKNGNVLEEYEDTGEQVVDPQYPRLINDILSDIDLRSLLFKNSLPLTQVPGYQIALKTGTTNDFVDAWTIGYSPDLVVGVWAGNNHREPLKSRAGSVLAAVPIWHAFAVDAFKKFAPDTFTKPDPIQSDNPVLRGELPAGDRHEVLYYLNRQNDSQYKNWEAGLQEWLKTNSPDTTKFAVADSTPASPAPAASAPGADDTAITVSSPKNGDTFTDGFNINAQINSPAEIAKIEVYFNNGLLDSKIGDLGQSYSYTAAFSPALKNQQNLLTIKVADKNGKQTEKSLILFH